MQFEAIELFTNVLPDLKEFYTRLLGLELLSDSTEEFTVILPGGTLSFKAAPAKHVYHFAFNIPENQIEEAKDFIEGITEVITDNETDQQIIDFVAWNAHSLYFFDPAGNIVELIARHDLPNKSNEVFSGKSLLSISEIGLPVQDVQQSFSKISPALEINRYSGDFERFCAAGDENGLFIITGLKRNWFPTDTPSIPEPFTAIVRHNNLLVKVQYKNEELLISKLSSTKAASPN